MRLAALFIALGIGVPSACSGPSLAAGRHAAQGQSIEALKAEIDSLKAEKVAWREIAWKSCLLDGLRESRAKKKPVLLWIFIDRPVDDARC